jgi:hypothetical protein
MLPRTSAIRHGCRRASSSELLGQPTLLVDARGDEEYTSAHLIAGDLTVGELLAGQTAPLLGVYNRWGHVDRRPRLSAPLGALH